MEGITLAVYRNVHSRFFPGVEAYFTPFLSANQTLHFKGKEIRDILPEHNRISSILIPQVMSNKAEEFVWAVKELASYGYGEVNLNLGCPFATVVNRHKGSGFLEDPSALDRFFEQVFDLLGKEGSTSAISVKTRVGLKDAGKAMALMEIYNRYPVKNVIIHPRTREDMYENTPDMETFSRMYEASIHPVIYNGDVLDREDILRLTEEFPNLDGIMIGRGFLRNPALLRETEGGEKCSREELFTFLKALYDEYLEYYGQDYQALCKLKEIWWYLGKEYPEKERALRQIRKAGKRSEYEEAVRRILWQTEG